MSVKKDQLKEAMAKLSQPTPNPFTGIKPMSLDDLPPKSEQPTAQNTVNNTATGEAKPPRKNVKATLNKRKWGQKQTKGFKFEITPELQQKLYKRQAEIQLTTGKKISTSEIIRNALARELRDI